MHNADLLSALTCCSLCDRQSYPSGHASLARLGFRSAPRNSGWVQRPVSAERSGTTAGRQQASLLMAVPGCASGWKARSSGNVKEVRASNVRQAKRYAERWCAARLYRDLPLREAVARLTDNTPPIQLPPAQRGLRPDCGHVLFHPRKSKL